MDPSWIILAFVALLIVVFVEKVVFGPLFQAWTPESNSVPGVILKVIVYTTLYVVFFIGPCKAG